jgi:Anti-sigma-28 factor, FlgM
MPVGAAAVDPLTLARRQGRRTMYRHGPTCLEGPVSRNRLAWLSLACENTDNAPADDIRTDLVERVRREIAAGTYDTPEKWDAALERLWDRLQQPE